MVGGILITVFWPYQLQFKETYWENTTLESVSAAAPGPLVGNPKFSVALLIFQLETPPAWALYNRNMEFGKKGIKIKNKKWVWTGKCRWL